VPSQVNQLPQASSHHPVSAPIKIPVKDKTEEKKSGRYINGIVRIQVLFLCHISAVFPEALSHPGSISYHVTSLQHQHRMEGAIRAAAGSPGVNVTNSRQVHSS